MSAPTANIFEVATRTKVRFPSIRGPLSLEQLWDVPLRSKDGFDLNAIAKAVNSELKTALEENFVDSTRSPSQTKSELTLEVIKYIIQVKLDEEEVTRVRAAQKAEKEKLLEILSRKQDEALDSLSEKEIRKRLESLSGV